MLIIRKVSRRSRSSCRSEGSSLLPPIKTFLSQVETELFRRVVGLSPTPEALDFRADDVAVELLDLLVLRLNPLVLWLAAGTAAVLDALCIFSEQGMVMLGPRG